MNFILIAVVLYGGFAGLLYLMQYKFVYYPETSIHYSPADVGLVYEDITMTTSDGIQIHGWFLPHEQSRATILYFHGNAGNLSDRVEFLQQLHGLDVSIFGIDYRGYGYSEGKPTPRGTYRDAETAWDYLVQERNIPPDEIIIYGRSLGGAIASWLAVRKTPAALMLGSTFTSAETMARKMFPIIPVQWFIHIPYNSEDHLPHVKCPVLISHSVDDDVVPFAHGKTLFDLANEPKKFLQLQGAHSNVVWASGRNYIEGLDAFISEFVQMKPPTENEQ